MKSVPTWVLTHEWRDGPNGVVVTIWLWSEAGPIQVRLEREEAVMFVERGASARSDRRRELELTTLEAKPVDALYFRSRRALLDARDRLAATHARTYESDVKPDARFLMERFVTGGARLSGSAVGRDGWTEMREPRMRAADVAPSLRLAAFDIETDGPDGALLAIAATDGEREDAWVIGSPADADGSFEVVPDELALIRAFEAWVRERDPDVLAGWNVVEFDLAVLCRRAEAHGRPLALGRGGETARVLLPDRPNGIAIPRVPGRVMMDGIATMRTFTFRFDSFGLDEVARAILGEGKAIDDGEDRVEEIRRMFREDKRALAVYNLRDAVLARRIFVEARLVELAIARQRLTGLTMDRQGGAVAAFDHLYLPRLHRKGHVAPDTEARETDPALAAPGGWVMEPEPGLHDDVLVLDFKSLYPSIIRTFAIDPLGMAFPGDDPVEGFGGAKFHREEHILPGLIETLWAAREDATKTGQRELATAIKILMNSFYGVLGTPACRFFDSRLASSITRRGHEVIRASREHIEARGHRVIYGDTDSLFVVAGGERTEEECRALGQELATSLTLAFRERLAREMRIESALEVRFETHYAKLLVPTMRGSERGSKKRYAGWARGKDGEMRVVVKGLEAVRTDWTPLARRFQRELFRRVFAGEPWESWARELTDALYAGALDAELVYRKRLRRELAEYDKSAPPHVQAARKLDKNVRAIEYVMTTRGPEPLARRESPIDHDHYFHRQLAPAADAILGILGTSLATVAGRQMSLF
jgi:DNA polymerase-2